MEKSGIFKLAINPFVFLALFLCSMGSVQGLECHNCVSKNADMANCKALTVDQVRTELRGIEGFQLPVAELPDTCVKIILQSGVDKSETVIRTQVKMDKDTKKAIYNKDVITQDQHHGCKEEFVRTYANKKKEETSLSACTCVTDHCNSSSMMTVSLPVLSSMLLIFCIKFYSSL